MSTKQELLKTIFCAKFIFATHGQFFELERLDEIAEIVRDSKEDEK